MALVLFRVGSLTFRFSRDQCRSNRACPGVCATYWINP